MCGRYSFSTSKNKLKQQFPQLELPEATLPVSYNIAPTQAACLITNNEPHRLQLFNWGLLPFWSKEGKLSGRMINARSEGIENKPAFRAPVRYRRCWVLADSFYEWKTVGGKKNPYRIFSKNGNLLTMAGIWDVWDKSDTPIYTFSVITCAPNVEMASIHDRMPVILPDKEQQQAWLQADLTEALELLQPLADGTLDMYAVSAKVNAVRNNGPALHERAAVQGDLFS